jgi:hypothetical protein
LRMDPLCSGVVFDRSLRGYPRVILWFGDSQVGRA